MENRKRRIVVGITGASGSVYALKFLQVLQDTGIEAHLVVTHSAETVLQHECRIVPKELLQYAHTLYNVDDIGAAIASGSFLYEAMVVIPCSMRTVGAVASGIADNLLTRAADVTIKEGRTLVMVPRETPFSPIHLENMLKLSRIGVRILPACPGFYHNPQSIDDLVKIMVGKVCDQLHIEHKLFKRWSGHAE
ncbi:UbiX family flavin prenyltransferase [Pectinatus cerevisiiphilus]|uniref:Flavin prenyltransferase UbiX n=1 Tax=Pectinatus cerevisiiphilus TaxID=86956 RepID=A0A4R3K9L5_9FIRM|nr:UbiX family flavin prenyltransferase [Pectinatus cerevisiiphilus]TCS79351.1 4-hydroxy-3-polyprenylbenzoate decarboxylase [Pectinatus cerevisiiphilus]